VLEVHKLTKHFDGLQAVGDLDFKVEKGKIIGLIGPNGAGKTTIFNLLSGFLKPTAGGIMFEGRDITGLKPHNVAALGMVRTFQLVNLVGKSLITFWWRITSSDGQESWVLFSSRHQHVGTSMTSLAGQMTCWTSLA